MKHLNEFLTVGTAVMAVISGIVLFQVTSVLADHDKAEKAHPELIQAIRDNEAAMELLSQKLDLGQKANEVSHDRQEKTSDTMVNMLAVLIEKSG